MFLFCLFLDNFLNSCGCSMAKSKTPLHEIFFLPLNVPLSGEKKVSCGGVFDLAQPSMGQPEHGSQRRCID